MSSKKRPSEGIIRNKRARFDYDLSDSIVVGIVLNGRETKNLRMGHGQLRGAYVTIKDGELYLINASINGSRGIPIDESEVSQARKLLAKRKEIDQIIAAKKQGRTIVPIDILTRGRFIKVRIALGTGKKTRDKRQVINERDSKRSAEREMKNKYR